MTLFRIYDMSDFPTLKTGAILQYPAQKAVRFSSVVLRFTDGAEQRFRDFQAPLRRWMIRLDLLDQTELHVLREFFRAQSGAAGTFTFTDPWDSTVYLNCSFENGEMTEELLDEMKGKTVWSAPLH
jgi:phage-related protein